jgi:hypothetical protein
MTFVRLTGKIEIYKIDIVAKTVVETSSLHDHALFLGHNQTLCLRADEHPPLKADHAYFTDDSEPWIRIIVVILEYSTWMATAGRKLSLLSFGPTGLLLYGLHQISQICTVVGISSLEFIFIIYI